MLLNKATLVAIARRLPVYLTGGSFAVEIRAETAFFENGAVRSRRLYRGDLPKILAVCREIFVQGGEVCVDSLPWNELNLWRLGWTPELSPLRDELSARWRSRTYRGTPLW